MAKLIPPDNSTRLADFMPGRVLFVQTAFIGDVILATGLVESVKHKWPEAAIDMIVIPKAANILEHNPLLRRVIVFDKRGAQRSAYQLWRLARKLKSENYDLALVPHRSLRSALLVWLAGIPQRVGFDRGVTSFLFHHRVKFRQAHEVERNLDLLRPFGGGEIRPPRIYWTNEESDRIDALLQEKTLGIRPLLALAPGSVWYTKRWPLEYFQELAWSVLEKMDGAVVLIGGTEDVALCNQIGHAVGGHCFSVAGQLSLRQTAALLHRCDVLVSNDSAPTHLGVAAQCRVITIFGSTVPAFGFAPYDPAGNRHAVLEHSLPCRPCTDHGRRECPLGTLECLNAITPERVLARIEEMLKECIRAYGENLAHRS